MNNQKGRDFSQAEFRFPKSENGLIYTWVWNAPIDRAAIDKKLEEFQKVGIDAFYILPYPKNFRPDCFVPDTELEYLSQEFFELVKYALDQAKRADMEVWLYDEGGFPSGGAAGKTLAQNPDAQETVLNQRTVSLKANEKYVPNQNAVVAFCGKQRVPADFCADKDTDLTEYCTQKANWLVPNRFNRVDSTNKSVIDTFIANTYEAYKANLGDGFGGASAIFTDEPSVLTNMIPDGFFEKFAQTYGYDLKDFIYCIHDKNLAETEQEQLARIHYGTLLGDLFYHNFCKNIGDWCAKNKILFTGHLDIDHLPEGASRHGYFSHLRCLSAFRIPGVDLIWHQIQIPENGRPIAEEGAPFFMRMASSAAHQSGGNLAVTESFAVYGDGLTPDEFRYVLNYQAMRGINVFNVMITTAGDKRMQALVQRPVFTSAKPGFYNMNHINAYYKRLSYLLRLGEPQIDTALYLPCADFWANEAVSCQASASYTALGTALENAGIEFDIIDDYAIRSADVGASGLSVGDMLYKNIAVPACQFMPADVREKIKPFIKDHPCAQTSTVRTMKRKLASGMLYFFFNEGTDTQKITVGTTAGRLYRLNPATGEITGFPSGEIEAVCGEIVVLYRTDTALNTVSEQTEYSVALKEFHVVKATRFTVALDGISMRELPVPLQVTDEFSGEITFRTEYELPQAPAPHDRYKIVLRDTAVSARISADGKQIATFGMTPMEAVVTGESLHQKGVMEITVANTAANEIAAKKELIATHPVTVSGPVWWHEKSLQYEKDAPAVKFGHVVISKLK